MMDKARAKTMIVVLMAVCVTAWLSRYAIRANEVIEVKPVKINGFNPKDLGKVEFFVESIHGLAIAKGTEYYDKQQEYTPLPKVWSDMKRFPHGTVRWWQDQSSYKRKKLSGGVVFKTGRDIGQDDHDRPGYIPDGCNGKPSIRGGLIGKGEAKYHNKQPCYFECQVGNRDLSIQGPFSLFLLIKPVTQQNEFIYFGVFHKSTLSQKPDKHSLQWKNSGKPMALSKPNSVELNQWQMIEMHRDDKFELTCFINGKNVTAGNPTDPNPFVFLQLFNNNKGQGFGGKMPFIGDMAALLIYRDELSEEERVKVRTYFDGIYKYMP